MIMEDATRAIGGKEAGVSKRVAVQGSWWES